MWKCPDVNRACAELFASRFDMRVVGNLQDPVTLKFLRKRMRVMTTQYQMWNMLNDRFCRNEHQHQPIQGTTIAEGNRVNVSTFTEWYTRKFARQIARVMAQDSRGPCKWPIHALKIGRNEDPEPPARKRLRIWGKQANHKRTGDQPDSNSQKRLKIEEPTVSSGETWNEAFEVADKQAPRVGRLTIRDGPLVEIVQRQWPDATVKFVIVCRGTDRHQKPTEPTPSGEAPLRRMVLVHRKFGHVHAENEWEPWEKLTYKQMHRKTLPAKMCIIAFGRAKNVPEVVPVLKPRSRRESEQNEFMHRAKAEPDASRPTSTGMQPASIVNQGAPMDPNAREIIDLTNDQHGPLFQKLDADKRQLLMKIHKNLGHPGSQQLQTILRQQGWSSDVISAIPDMKCSACQETQRPRISRPATCKPDLDFGDIVSMDGIRWQTKEGKSIISLIGPPAIRQPCLCQIIPLTVPRKLFCKGGFSGQGHRVNYV